MTEPEVVIAGRPDRFDVGGRAGSGRCRRGHRRTACQPGCRRDARRRSVLAHDRGPHRRGIADRFLAAGQAVQVQAFAGVAVDIGDLPTRQNYGLALWQKDFEPILVRNAQG